MSQEPYILDQPLSPEQNYVLLKEEGLARIQEWSNTNWTNLNADDPGVTILEQVCYALTELGYCLNFSIADILTKANGKIEIENQFYLPQDILTTSPVTLNDYRKYVIDGTDGIRNVLIKKATTPIKHARVYQTLLYVDPNITTDTVHKNICKAVFFQLNKVRNLNECFLLPTCLRKKEYLLQGTLLLNSITNVNDFAGILQNAIAEFIFPTITPKGYAFANASTFEGPYLKNGFISDENLGDLKTKLDVLEIGQLLENIPLVKSYTGIYFLQNNQTQNKIYSTQSQILTINIAESIRTNALKLMYNGLQLLPENDTGNNLVLNKKTMVYGQTASTSEKKFQGTFKDIGSYYTIQNTFPEIYGVGEIGLPSNTGTYRKAQVNQLKGYLTLYDQLLANAFTQLSNLDKLFSFKNTLTGAPTDEEYYYATKTEAQKQRNEYPVPYKVFSPTYFYQSLYTVPNIMPLLKNYNSLFKNRIDESNEKLCNEAWFKYKTDPYNAYIAGMLNLIEDEDTNLTRRNTMLNHLLARHGESPLELDFILNEARFTGNSIKDQILYKSLYLQNLSWLSYYRCKAYNYIGAEPIPTQWPTITQNYIEQLLVRTQIDFIVDLKKIEDQNIYVTTDYVNYSALELKICLLLGLNTIYTDFILQNYGVDNPDKLIETELATWMIEYRKGTILLETNLLFQSLEYVFHIRDKKNKKAWEIKNISFEQAHLLSSWALEYTGSITDEFLKNESITVLETTYMYKEIVDFEENLKWWNITENLHVEISITPTLEITNTKIHPNTLFIFYPDFIQELNTNRFTNRLSLLLKNNVPVGITPIFIPCNTIELVALIELYTPYHNSLIYKSSSIKTTSPSFDSDNTKVYQLIQLLQQLLEK